MQIIYPELSIKEDVKKFALDDDTLDGVSEKVRRSLLHPTSRLIIPAPPINIIVKNMCTACSLNQTL